MPESSCRPPTTTPRPAGPTRRRRRAGWFVVVALLVAAASGPAGAQDTDPAAAEKAQQQQTQSKKAETQAQLDVLAASDVQLKAELGRIDSQIAENQATEERATAERDAALSQLDELRVEVARAEEAERRTNRAAVDRAVAVYMRPTEETASQLLSAKDPDELGRMRVLITHVAEYDHAVLTNHQTAQHLLEVQQNQLDAVEQQAEAAASEARASRDELAALRETRAVVADELETRIDELRGEVEALNAQEAQLTSLIAQRQAAATTTTTAAPTTTTTAPTTTTSIAPGSGSTPSSSTSTTTAKPTTTTTRPSGGISLSWPVSGTVTSPFGPRWGLMHSGIDIGAASGAPISAAAAGTVFFSGTMGGYGNVILIDHGNGIVTLYGHQSQLIAANGQTVSRGQTIGLVGSTGHSTGPHLHFEVRVNGVAVDPMGYLG